MPINTETLNRRLYKVLSKYKPKPLDSSGEVTPIEDEADIFKFTFTKNGEQYGEVYATIDDSRTLKIYYGDDVIDSPEAPTPGVDYDDTWFGFLRFLKSWAHQNQLGWDLENKDHLAGDMARREHVKKTERISEGYYPMGKKASYSDAIPTVKMVIQHSREIQEGEQRYRNVARIFLENQLGERILAPTTKPGIAQIYARHIAEGGLPHDERWNHIGSLCEEYNKMAGFVRATRGGQFNESAQQLVESGIQHYNKLRESLSKMRGHRGYNMYFESWTPPLMEDETDTSSINELFVQETMDPRIESVMPILSKLHKTVAEMREVDELAEWADNLLEGGDGPEASEETDGDTPGDAGEGGAEDAPDDNLTEAPGAETLAHNQATEKSRLDAFDLDENILDRIKDVGQKALDKLGHGSDEDLLKDLKKRAGVRNPENGKPSMAHSDVEKVDEVDMGQYDAVKSSPKGSNDDDVFKNFREKLRQYGDELEQRQKEKSEKVDEELDADQKRAGQWGPTGGPAKIGNLVGESINEGALDNIRNRMQSGSMLNRVRSGAYKAPAASVATQPPGYDTETGKPLPPEARFDPHTGKPLPTRTPSAAQGAQAAPTRPAVDRPNMTPRPPLPSAQAAAQPRPARTVADLTAPKPAMGPTELPPDWKFGMAVPRSVWKAGDDPNKNPNNPIITHMVKVRDALTKQGRGNPDAIQALIRKALNGQPFEPGAFQGWVDESKNFEENFIGMSPQAVAEGQEDLDVIKRLLGK